MDTELVRPIYHVHPYPSQIGAKKCTLCMAKYSMFEVSNQLLSHFFIWILVILY